MSALERRGLVWLMAAAAGLVVANNYYNQPLLGSIARELAVSERQATLVSSLTQTGYALGLFLLLPLGDLRERRGLISTMLVLAAGALALFACAGRYAYMVPAGFLVGLTSIVPQLLPPVANQLAEPGQAAQAVGKVMAGLLLGIVLSRFVGGWLGALLGWRAVYWIAAGAMLSLLALLRRALPVLPPSFQGSYAELMRSLVPLWRRHPLLRALALSAALQFGAFSLFWATLAFHLEAMPGRYSSEVAGTLALVGAGGVAGALAVGRFAARWSPLAILLVSGALMIAAFALFAAAASSLWWMVPAVILLDLGMQMSHVTSMAQVLGLNRAAGSRLNTLYMSTRFAGGALGTVVGGWAWSTGGWPYVCAAGAAMCVAATVLNLVRRPGLRA